MIDFKDARLLSYDRTSQYFGESYRYAIQQHLVVEGSLYSLTNQSGVTPIWNSLADFVGNATDYNAILINGTNFGAGRINSITLVEGTDVRQKKYSVDLTIFSQGDLPNNIAALLPNIYLAENFNEIFEFGINEDGNHTYKQSVTIKYIKGGVISDPIAAAKSLASVLFNSPPAYGFIDNQTNQFYNSSGKHLYTENYNKITNECSFTKSFTQGELTDGSVKKLTQQIDTGEDGISIVSETGHIENVTDFDAAVNATDAYSRTNSLLFIYIPNAIPLNLNYVSLEKRINKFAKTIDYTIRFTNDPKIINNYSWEYSKEIGRGDDCYYLVKESGIIKGLAGACISTDKYNHALTAWTSTVKSGIAARVTAYYSLITGLNNSLKLLSSNERRSIHSGQISYDYSYTDDLTITNNIIKKVEISTTDHPPILLLNRFAVASVGEIVQSLGTSKEGKREISIKMLGRRGTALTAYLTEALSRLNALRPVGNDIFISACSYSFTPLENTFNLQLEWTYFGVATGDVVV